jgi:hypothetical protein
MENSRNKQFINFKLHAILSSVMKYHTVLLHSIMDVSHPFVQCIYNLYATCQFVSSHLSYQVNCFSVALLVFK